MSDRIPGSGPTNPIIYKGCAICIDDPETPGEEWTWWIIDQPAIMAVSASSESECKAMIDDLHEMLKGFQLQ